MIDKKTKDRLLKNPDVTSVGYGFKYTGGVKTRTKCLVVGVEKKKPRTLIRQERFIPRFVDGKLADVQERDIKALSFVGKIRPCPPGFSIGHTLITAGTLGCYVKRNGSEDWWILSNNHVLAASNQGKTNDKIIQPGKADGGFSGTDLFAWLREYVLINWDGNSGGGCNFAKRLWYRLGLSPGIEQPKPNLVDAAVALPANQGNVNRRMPVLDCIPYRLVNLELGDKVYKVGRTTEMTQGRIEGVDTTVRVRYERGTATFQDQIEIRSIDDRDFSAGGDSGSVILDDTMVGVGGLLFAGGSGVTIANRIGHVVDLLGIRM